MKYIKSFRELNEAESPEGSFVERALKALEAQGFAVEVTSSKVQLKNDNMACKIKFLKVLEFIKEYYGFDFETQAAYTGTMTAAGFKTRAANMSFDNIVFYKRGQMQKANRSNAEFSFSSVEDMAEKMKVYVAKELLYSAWQDSVIVFPKRQRKVVEERHSAGTQEVKWSKSLESQHSRELPLSAKKILDSVTGGFSREYDALYSFDPDSYKMCTLALCSCIELHYLNKEIPEIEEIHPTHCKLKIGYNAEVQFQSYTVSMVKNLFTKKTIYYFSDGVVCSWYHNRDWFEAYREVYLRLQKLSQQELNAYFDNFFSEKRGVIAGKKFGF